jgi:UDP-2,3-diacylglucosamine hydrolase
VTRRFLELVRRETGRARCVYFLGDLFDFWIGPRHLDHASRTHPGASGGLVGPVRETFAACTRAGTDLALLLGNREHLFGRRCAGLLGVEWAADQIRLDLDGTRVLCVHGDLFTTRDFWYRFSRWLLRWRPVHGLRDIVPEGLVHFLATNYVKVSARATSVKERRVLEIVPEELARAFAKADVVVSGHFHEARIRRFKGVRGDYVLYQLGSWETGGSALVYENRRFELQVW